MNFLDYDVWSFLFLFAVLLITLLIGNIIRRKTPFLRDSLVPTSVLGGIILIIVTSIYRFVAGESLFDTSAFNFNGTETLEIITYHCLALGFIASTLKTTNKELTKERSVEVFNTGVTTVATYLLQGVVGLAITIVISLIVTGFFPAAGMLLPFGFGQGTGQAMNYGNIYEADFSFTGGLDFGLAVAALGFISASVGGVIHLNIMKRKGKLHPRGDKNKLNAEQIEAHDELPMQDSIDKMTIQIAMVALAYTLTYLVMLGLSKLVPGMASTIFGFNFLIGVIMALLVKLAINKLRKHNIFKHECSNNFLLTRISNFFFDLMVVSGIAAIRIETILNYWGALIALGVIGLVITYAYNRFIAKKLFPNYFEEQFLAMYGMLTGTASTGIILLREIDAEFETPAADNLVYQNLPAIVFGLPLLFLATFAPKAPVLTLIILFAFFVVMNIILFRSFIFKRKKQK